MPFLSILQEILNFSDEKAHLPSNSLTMLTHAGLFEFLPDVLLVHLLRVSRGNDSSSVLALGVLAVPEQQC